MDAIELMKVQARGMAITVKRNHCIFFNLENTNNYITSANVLNL